jgi:hypothetical protein
MSDSQISLTLERADAVWVLETAERAVNLASSARHPRLLAHRERAEQLYQEAVARRDRLFAAAEEANR